MIKRTSLNDSRVWSAPSMAVAIACALALLLVFGGCEPSDKTASATPSETAAPVAPDKAKADGAGADGQVKQAPDQKPNTPKGSGEAPVTKVQEQVSGEIYPGLPVGLLKPEERKTLVKVMGSQLCPCPKATTSMDQCLRKEATQCELALQTGMEAMRKINEGQSERDVLDGVGQYIEAAYKKYSFDLKTTPYIGKPDAPVVIVEFADFECPYCNLARGIMKEVLKKHGDDVVFYFKQYPLGAHSNSTPAAMAALAAHKQGKFWPMYDLLFDNQNALSEAKILELAQNLGLNMDRFRKDWRSPEVAAAVALDRKDGESANVTATPSFYINGRKFLGDKTPEGFAQAIKAAAK